MAGMGDNTDLQNDLKNSVADALAGDLEIDSNFYADGSTESEEGVVGEEEIEVVQEGEDGVPVQTEEASQEGATSEEKTEEKKEDLSNIFSVEVQTEDGAKTLKVDLSDKDKLSKIVSSAHEAVNLRKEVTTLKADYERLKPQYEQMQQVMDRIEQASEEGVHSLIDLLLNEKGAFDRIVQEKLEERSFYETATPEQIEAYEAKKELEKYKKRDQHISEKAKKDSEAASKAKEEAEMAQLSSTLNAAFLKNSINGEFDDSELEDSINEQIWEKTKAAISKYPAEVKITQKLAEQEFARWKKHYVDIYSRNVTKKAAQVVEKKKEEAQEKVTSTVKEKVTPTKQDARVNKAIKDNDFVSAFKSLFGG